MNEIKRQLNKKLGDTTSRTNSVIQKIEQGKKRTRMPKNKMSNAPIYMAITSFVAVLALFLLVGPFGKESNQADPVVETPPVNGPDEEEDSSYKDLLRSYFFKADGDVAYFHGIGNEYASYTETTTWISEDYIAILIVNGGIQTLTIYRITDDSIEVLVRDFQEEDAALPTVEALDEMPALYTLIEAPFDGQQSKGRTIQLNVPFKTPYSEVKALVIEEKFEESDAILTSYYAAGLGFVGSTYKDYDSLVASYLNSINVAPTPDNAYNDLTIDIYNETTKQTDNYPIEMFEVIDPYLFKMDPESYAMTYRALHETAAAELGIFTYQCDEQENCSNILVAKKGPDFTIIRHFSGSYGNLSFSPNNSYVIIPNHITIERNNTTVERDGLLLIDLNTMTSVHPANSPLYFGAPTYPIVSFKWLSNNSIEIVTAGVTNYMHDDLYNWQTSANKSTFKVIVELP
jgi:predicted GH43/DUF377 family glycosyl hydrolase